MQVVTRTIDKVLAPVAGQKYEFKWAGGFSSRGISAETAVQVIQGISQRTGCVTPDILVNESKPEDAPLHKLFEWDDAEAADLYREDQARWIIRHLVVVTKEPTSEVTPPQRLFIKIAPVQNDADRFGPVETATEAQALQPNNYMAANIALQDTRLRKRYMHAAIRELRSWCDKYEHLDELADLISYVKSEAARVAA